MSFFLNEFFTGDFFKNLFYAIFRVGVWCSQKHTSIYVYQKSLVPLTARGGGVKALAESSDKNASFVFCHYIYIYIFFFSVEGIIIIFNPPVYLEFSTRFIHRFFVGILYPTMPKNTVSGSPNPDSHVWEPNMTSQFETPRRTPVRVQIQFF